MIICSCTRLDTSCVRSVLERCCADDPYGLVTPGRVFSMTGERMQCGCCAALVNETIVEELRRLQEMPPDPSISEKD